MALKMYLDHHVPRAITNGLRTRNIDVLTAFEDGFDRADDPALLDRATALGRVLFSQDDDLLTEATHRQTEGIPFFGVVFGHQLNVTIGQCVRNLEVIARVGTEDDVQNQIIFLPL